MSLQGAKLVIAKTEHKVQVDSHMFGLLDLGSCSLAKNKRRFYMCGVCNALACGYGRFSRLLLSGDDAFLSLLMTAQRRKILFDDSAPIGKCRFWSREGLACA